MGPPIHSIEPHICRCVTVMLTEPGDIPARFRWESQRDEGTCDLCGLLDGREMNISQLSFAFGLVIGCHESVKEYKFVVRPESNKPRNGQSSVHIKTNNSDEESDATGLGTITGDDRSGWWWDEAPPKGSMLARGRRYGPYGSKKLAETMRDGILQVRRNGGEIEEAASCCLTQKGCE